MGISRSTLEFLLECQACGVELGETVTLGRQDLLVNYDDIAELLQKYGHSCSEENITEFYEKNQQFAEPILTYIGAKKVVSIDSSDFEGATIVHDFNDPLPDKLKGAFDSVIDGGTTEHVFNLPQAMKNCMDLLKSGGHIISILPANNYCGHGFYQFSPELLFRIFSEENGFRVKKMIFCIHQNNDEWYEVIDPKIAAKRIEPKSLHPSELLMVAEKMASNGVFRKMPQQSDYANEWANLCNKGENVDRLHFWRGSKVPSNKSPIEKTVSVIVSSLKGVIKYILKRFCLHRVDASLDMNTFTRYKRR